MAWGQAGDRKPHLGLSDGSRPPRSRGGMGLPHFSREGQSQGLQVTDTMTQRPRPMFGLQIKAPAAHQHLAGVSLNPSWRPGSIPPSLRVTLPASNQLLVSVSWPPLHCPPLPSTRHCIYLSVPSMPQVPIALENDHEPRGKRAFPARTSHVLAELLDMPLIFTSTLRFPHSSEQRRLGQRSSQHDPSCLGGHKPALSEPPHAKEGSRKGTPIPHGAWSVHTPPQNFPPTSPTYLSEGLPATSVLPFLSQPPSFCSRGIPCYSYRAKTWRGVSQNRE